MGATTNFESCVARVLVLGLMFVSSEAMWLRGGLSISSPAATGPEDPTLCLEVEVSLGTGTGKCPPRKPPENPDLKALREIDNQPDFTAPHKGNQSVIVQPNVRYFPSAPKIGLQAGHPDKNEMDTLDGLFRMAYKKGFASGWARGDAEKEKNNINMDGSGDDTGADGVSSTDQMVDEIAESVTDPPSVEDGGKMSDGAATEAAMASVGSDISNGPPERDTPDPPDDPTEKQSVNQMSEKEAEEGGIITKDYVTIPDRVPSRSDPNYISPSQIEAMSDAPAGDPDSSSLCAMEPQFCKRSVAEEEPRMVVKTDEFWEPGLSPE